MQALKATSELLKSPGPTQAGMAPYAGPQCYLQLKERLMANAPDTACARGRGGGRGAAQAPALVDAAALEAVKEQVEGCWLRCADCGARRLVERGSLASLRSEAFQKVSEGSVPGFWGQWLRQARVRYDAFVKACEEGGAACPPCQGSRGPGN